MQKLSRFSKKITCPRCGLKVYEEVPKCPDCGLIFSRLDIATNRDAKKLMQKGERDFILKSTRLPSDVSFIKLLLLSIFLGPVGAHCFYVGRYYRASVILLDMIAIFLLVAFNGPLLAIDDGALLGSFSTICGIIMLMWPWDVLMIITKKFKVPIAINITSSDIDELEKVESENTLEIDKQIKSQINLEKDGQSEINDVGQSEINNDSKSNSLEALDDNIVTIRQEKNKSSLDKNAKATIKQGKDILDNEELYNPITWKEEQGKRKSKKRNKQ